jgi:hypothetical protein
MDFDQKNIKNWWTKYSTDAIAYHHIRHMIRKEHPRVDQYSLPTQSSAFQPFMIYDSFAPNIETVRITANDHFDEFLDWPLLITQ